MGWPENKADDELAKRRTVRGSQGQSEGDEPDMPHFTWQDILAMIIAAYQVILPIVLLFIGIMILVYFLFRWWVL